MISRRVNFMVPILTSTASGTHYYSFISGTYSHYCTKIPCPGQMLLHKKLPSSPVLAALVS